MSTNDLSFLVLGAGAIGGITAALLKKNGFDVGIVCKYDNYASNISELGIEVNGVCGNFTVKIPAYDSVSDVREKNDINLHATTATDSMKLKIEVYGGRLDFRNFIYLTDLMIDNIKLFNNLGSNYN